VSDSWLASTYGERFAPVYDDWYGDEDVTPIVDTLADLAAGGPVLELGAGTGRLAIPLAQRGLDVDALDASEAMLARLRTKPGADRIRRVIAADMGDVGHHVEPGSYGVVVVAANTLFLLDTGDAQARCVAGAALALRPGGRLVVEAFVPDLERLAAPAADTVTVRSVEPDRVVLFATKSDVDRQTIDTAIVELTDGAPGVRVFPARLRWSTSAELDAIAASAGLALEARWSDWDRKPCDESADTHVSVWRASVG
jgi:SAM-dependent methyltransferase